MIYRFHGEIIIPLVGIMQTPLSVRFRSISADNTHYEYYSHFFIVILIFSTIGTRISS